MLHVYCIFNLLDGTQELRKIKQYKSWKTFFRYYAEKHPYQVVYVQNRFDVWTRCTGYNYTYVPDASLPCPVKY